LERLDEKNKDEADSVSNVLGIIENIIEVKPGFTLDSTKQGLLQWLLKRIKVKQTIHVLKLLYNFLYELFLKGERIFRLE
jgi:beta-catenin-like protein 1